MKKFNIRIPKFKKSYNIIISVVLLVIFLALNYMPRGSYPVVVASDGITAITKAAGSGSYSRGARLEDIMTAGMQISVKNNSFLDIYLYHMYRMRFKQGTEIKTEALARSSGGATRLRLDKGEVLVTTGLNFYNSHIRIDTPNASVFVVGTSFIVDYDPDSGDTWIAVARGEVVVKRKDIDELVVIRERQKAIVKKDGTIELPTAINKEELARLKEIGSVGRIKLVLIFPRKDSIARALFGPIRLYIQGRYPEPAHIMTAKALNIYNIAMEQNNRRKHLQSLALLNRVVKEYPDPANDPQILLFLATYYEKLGMYDQSVEALTKVITGYPKSKWVAVAQCAIGILKEEKLNDRKGAIAAYRRVLDNYPGSSEDMEAASGLERLKDKEFL